jgi:hypothetical protein
MQRSLWTVGFALLALGAGCSGGSPASLKGKVSYDGQPVDNGGILFLPADESSGVKLAAAIENGEYVIPAERGAVPGVYRVEIRWSKKTGKQIPSADPGMTVEETKEALPAQFNTNSTLSREIKAGENMLDFELSSTAAP